MQRQSEISRRGNVAVLTIILLIPMIAMVAFGVDWGYILVVRGELQNAADAAALAGVSRLLDRDELKGTPDQTAENAAARKEAIRFAALNKAGGIAIALDRNDENSADGDIVLGYLSNSRDWQTPLDRNTKPYNAIQVTAHRDAQRNGSLRLFFAPVIGTDSCNLQATATAMVAGSNNVQGFKITSSSSQTSKLLPFALDVNTWNSALGGTGGDDWSYDPATKKYVAGQDGIREIKLYPFSTAAGNFGTIDIGSANNSTADLERQIRYGPNKADLDAMGGQFALGSDGTVTVTGDTGISAGMKDAIAAIRGQPRIIPLYRPPVDGSGNDAQYAIVGFAGVVVLDVNMTGPLASKQITIQPEFVFDSTAFLGPTKGTSRFIYLPPTLTR